MKSYPRAFVAAVLAAFVVSCGGGKAAAGKKTTVTFWHAMGGPLGDALTAMVAEFELANPDVNIEPISMGGYTALSQKLMGAVQVDAPPNMAQMYESWTTQFHQMKEAISNSRARLESFSRHLLSHFESGELTADVKSRMFPYREKFQPGINDLENLIVDSEKKIEEYSTLLNEYKAAALGDAGGDAGVAFGRYHSLTEFLLTLKSRWGGIVTNEKEAMEKAIHYYVEAFAGGRDISPGNQQIQASYLIAELSRRIGDYDQARQYFNSTIKHGQEFIYQNRKDPSRTALARKILELAIEQGKANMEALKSA